MPANLGCFTYYVLNLQARYRYAKAFEPVLEFYAGQYPAGIGVVAVGRENVGIGKNLSWEACVILGLGNDSPDQSFRFLLEFEF
ncbi:MAG: hypothetical protein ACJA2D_002900 [Pseudohongiellaceae bacterium]|jgi:hypothetical protein